MQKTPRWLPWIVPAIFLASCSSDGNPQHSHTASADRTYFIAADEVAWDYAPSGINMITGQPFDDVANVFVKNGPDRIGKVYKKAVFRGYTDSTFTTQTPPDPRWEHLGTLGPVIRAVVGEHIDVVFKNNTEFPRSVHVHGLEYDKNSEGAPYGGDPGPDDIVAPGATVTYHFNVPDRSGPGPNDGTSVFWMYHSHVDEPVDVNSGLMGAIIVTANGHAREDGSPDDVDREFITLFEVMDENMSSYLEENIKTYTGDPASVDPNDEEFQESNLMHSINAYVYGNLPGLVMKRGERVRWYVMAMGTEVDLHTPHWHGQTLLVNNMRADVVQLLPAGMIVGDMIPDEPGTWLLHCHVNDHIIAGMLALFTVE
jgi:hephaestin